MLRNVIAVAAMMAASVAATAQEVDATLNGTVIGADGQPKIGVAVDVMGPVRIFTETSATGEFSVGVRKGTYVVRIREGSRRMEIDVQVNPGANQLPIRLSW